MLVAVAVGFSGCGKKTETAGLATQAASYPLPDPPVVADCAPGIPGGRLVVVSYGDPKTFNPITANEQSSEEIYRHLFAALLGFDWPSQQLSPGWPNRGPTPRTARLGHSNCGRIYAGATANR